MGGPPLNVPDAKRHLEDARVLQHVAFEGGYRLLIFTAPQIAAAAAPGQFVHVRVPALSPEALRRPFSIYRVRPPELHVLYKPVGRGTQAMVDALPGAVFSLIGPLGHGFPTPAPERLPVCVAGGYGVAPLSFLAGHTGRPGVVFIGARHAADILCVTDFETLGWTACVATEDGSRGDHGRVTASLDRWQAARGPADQPLELFGCGPEGLMRALAERAARWEVPAWLSLDRPMGCGIGACLACVQRVRDDAGRVAWARCCTEGPVFPAARLVWEEAPAL